MKLLPLCYWHDIVDILFLFKSHYDIVNFICDILPNPQNIQINIPDLQISSCTSQKSRVWNILPRDLTNNGLTLKELRKKLFNYYGSPFDNCYDVDDPSTWKSVYINTIKPEA